MANGNDNIRFMLRTGQDLWNIVKIVSPYVMKSVTSNCLLPASVWIVLFFTTCQPQPGTQYPPGGYEYPATVSGRDTNFYFYPIRDKFSRKDSFNASLEYIFYHMFDEPNLSLKPMPEETFRLYYSNAFHYCIFITLTKNQVTVKKGYPGSEETPYDSLVARLPPIEALHLKILERRYPLDAFTGQPAIKRYLDSMTHLYPELLDVRYYYKLTEKVIAPKDTSFHYEINRVPITGQQYDSIAQAINRSGYWSMPYSINKCKGAVMDGDAFRLEANTKNKYNMTLVSGCPGDTSAFTKACQEIIKLAKLDKEIKLVWSWKETPE